MIFQLRVETSEAGFNIPEDSRWMTGKGVWPRDRGGLVIGSSCHTNTTLQLSVSLNEAGELVFTVLGESISIASEGIVFESSNTVPDCSVIMKTRWGMMGYSARRVCME
jgi:hypothetical protein